MAWRKFPTDVMVDYVFIERERERGEGGEGERENEREQLGSQQQIHSLQVIQKKVGNPS